MNNIKATGIVMLLLAIVGIVLFQSCSENVNTNEDSHFTADGYLLTDTTVIPFKRSMPSSVKFFVEVSGSMNGFFRKDRPTRFKTDVWNVLSTFSPLSPTVTILTDDGAQGATLPLDDFRKKMNGGKFESSASTKVPVMLQSIIDGLNPDTGEVAVLISDMKYSPVGSASPEVLMDQYCTDINRIIGQFGKAVSIVCATSDYLDKMGTEITSRSPYYYVILGNQENVAEMRNHISLLLKTKGSFVDNIESGFNFGHPEYSFGISNKCFQFDQEPTFLEYEEAEDGDTCTITLKVPLENYRWLMADEEIFKDALQVATIYGSNVEIGNIEISVKDITGSDHKLNREAIAKVDLKVYNMPTDSEVIEWNLEIPSTDQSLLSEFIDGATDENDPTKSYSFEAFLCGIFQGGVVVHDMKPNYILISKED